MHIFIVTRGSLGDVQPFVALGAYMKASGHEVTICTHSTFEPLISSHDLLYGYMNDELTHFIKSHLRNEETENPERRKGFFRNTSKIIRQLRPIRQRMHSDSWESVKKANPDLILFHPQAFWAPDFAEKMGIPVVMATITPSSVPTGEFPHLLFTRCKTGNWGNRLSYQIAAKLFASEKRRSVHEWRQHNLPSSGRQKALLPDSGLGHRIPVLHAHSPSAVPVPADWPDHAFVTGYWFLDRKETWQPPSELTDFLEQGAPPVYIGFGSIPGSDPKQLLSVILKTLERADMRGLITSGGDSLPINDLPEHVFGIDDAPHEWLFPRMAAVVHHGGAGTTAASLRSGCPTVICPLQGDQPFWGNRVQNLGVGSHPIPQKKLTYENLAAAILKVTSDENIRQKARKLGTRIRAENGLRNAADLIEKILATTRAVAQ